MTSFADYGRPRRVAGGLRARTGRGPIGASWWSRRFLSVLESFALGTRLTRGRSYARAGQVLSLTVAPGTVTASVQGSRPRPYPVRIGLTPFPDPVWARIEARLAAQALFSARLLAGDLPPELEEEFAAESAPLFPAGVADLAMRCGCPDSAVPCKHLAATFYLLAEAFDDDPFQILHWRGRDRATLLTNLRHLRTPANAYSDAASSGGEERAAELSRPAVEDGAPGRRAAREPASSVSAYSDAASSGGEERAAELSRPAVEDGAPGRRAAREPASTASFWRAPVPLPARMPVPEADVDLLLRQLGPPPVALGGNGLADRLRQAYQRFEPAEPE